jgi:hypothetical protein
LRAGIAALVIVVLAGGCGVPPQPPTSSPTAPSPTPTATAAPSPTIACGRIDAASCAQAIEAARAFAPDAFAEAVLVVVDSECPPGAFCAFNAGSVVVVISDKAGTASAPWRAFVQRPNQPVFELSYPDLPRHVLELLPAEARPT